jgi:hypothetical protein
MGNHLHAVKVAVGVGSGFAVEWEERGKKLDGVRGCDMDEGGLLEPEGAWDTRGGPSGRLASG